MRVQAKLQLPTLQTSLSTSPVAQENVTSLVPWLVLQGFRGRLQFLWENIPEWVGIEVKEEDGALIVFGL